MSPQLSQGLALALGVFFAIAGAANLAGPSGLREGYARWGYPRGWHIVTGVLELAAGAAMLFPATRLFGVLLAATVAAAALATLCYHREWAHTPPSIALLAAFAAWLILRA